MKSVYEIRTASKSDVDPITTLFGSTSARYFGEKREPPLLQLFYEYQTHRLVIYESSEPAQMLAYCELCIYPNIPVLAKDCWPQWLKCRFCIDKPLTLMNTMFLNFFIHLPENPGLLKQTVMEVFYIEHKISFLVITRPPNYSPKEFEKLERMGKVYYPIAFDLFSSKNLPTIIIISRTVFMPEISFRKALPEDNDDVIEMIDVEEPEMRKENGDYFIAETLLGTAGGKMDRDQIIVTEEANADGSTGMMWLSDEVDIEPLVKGYDLESLGNLVRCTPDVPHGVVQFQVFMAQQRQHFSLNTKLFHSKRRTVHLSAQEVKNMRNEKETVFSKMKYISEELMKSSNYLDKISKTLRVSFDLPTGRGSLRNKKYTLNNACGAFMLKNFILHPDLRLEYTFYYLCAMFSAYPKSDYCVVPVSPGTRFSASLCALLKFFTRVEHRPSCQMSDDIFVAHRCSVSTELNVFRMEEQDLGDIYRLLNLSEKRETSADGVGSKESINENGTYSHLNKIVRQITKDVLYNQQTEFRVWIIRCGLNGRENTTTVGFAIVRPFSNFQAVHKQFLLSSDEDYLTYERGELVMLRLHPYFHMWSDELMRIVAIRSGYREVYYFQEIQGQVLPNDLAMKMMPVEPRRTHRNWFIDTQSEECYRRSSTQVQLSRINCVMDQFYLFRHNLYASKYFGNQKPLVIIGFSDICKAFLRLMIFGWNTPDFKHVSVNNCLPTVDITVIVNSGEVEAEYDPNINCDFCQRQDDCYLYTSNTCPFVMDTTQRLDIRNWINFVAAKVEHIDRDNKLVILDNNCKIYYDKLLLLNSTKFGLPPLNVNETVFDTSEMPLNYSHINGRLDKIILYNKLLELNCCKFKEKHIIIYGYTLAVYECINFLLKHGCKPQEIVYVQPHKVRQAEFLNIPNTDANLDDILVQMVMDLGICVHESANYESCTFYNTAYFIKKVNFTCVPSRNLLSLDCNLFINFNEKYLSTSMEKIFRKSGIRMRGSEIVVDDNFCTSDPLIYAAGNHVVFKYVVHYQYVHTSEREIAQKLINKMQLNQEPFDNDQKFSKPAVFHALLPLGHMIIKITSPKRFLLGCLSNEFCHVMTTYTGDFFRVRMSQKQIIEELVYVSRKVEKPLYFLEFFCGKHESLLNNLYGRWKLGMITDFVSFFEEPWTEYLMHDRFDEMQAKNHATLISLLKHKHCGVTGMNIGDSDFEEACKHFLEANLLKFLRKYRNEFVNKFVLPEDWAMDPNF